MFYFIFNNLKNDYNFLILGQRYTDLPKFKLSISPPRTTANDSERQRTTANDSERQRTTANDNQ
jgi:hypothetical protein